MEDLIEQTLEKYSLEYEKINRIRSGWLVQNQQELFLLKEVKQREKSLELSMRVQDYLHQQGVATDYVIANSEEELITKWESGEQYILCHWQKGESCDYGRNRHLRKAGENLGRLHEILADFSKDEEIVCETVVQKLLRYNREMKRVYSYIRSKKKKTEFEYELMKNYPVFYEKALSIYEQLKSCSYIQNQKASKSICHGEYNYHNVYFCDAEIFTCGFEHVHWGNPLMDLVYFLRKVMEKNNWREEKGAEILKGYSAYRELETEEKQFMSLLLAYPMKYRKLLNQYMNGKKSFISQKSVDKLTIIREQEEKKSQYLKEFV